MSDLLYKSGSPGPWITGPTYEDGPNGQRLTTYRAVGTEAQCLAQRNSWKISGAMYLTVGPKGDGNWECSAGFPWGIDGQTESPTDVHELDTNVQTPSVWTSVRLATLITATNLAIVQAIVEKAKSGEYGQADPEAKAFAAINAAVADVGAQRAMCRALWHQVAVLGMDTYTEYVQVYRRTITVSNPSQIKASQTGVGQIWKTNELMAFEGLTNAWYFVLPSSSLWLKSRPSVQTASRGKTQISYYYEECRYASSLTYNKYGSATEDTTNYFWS